jgi:hypothetical protein
MFQLMFMIQERLLEFLFSQDGKKNLCIQNGRFKGYVLIMQTVGKIRFKCKI